MCRVWDTINSSPVRWNQGKENNYDQILLHFKKESVSNTAFLLILMLIMDCCALLYQNKSLNRTEREFKCLFYVSSGQKSLTSNYSSSFNKMMNFCQKPNIWCYLLYSSQPVFWTFIPTGLNYSYQKTRKKVNFEYVWILFTVWGNKQTWMTYSSYKCFDDCCFQSILPSSIDIFNWTLFNEKNIHMTHWIKHDKGFYYEWIYFFNFVSNHNLTCEFVWV